MGHGLGPLLNAGATGCKRHQRQASKQNSLQKKAQQQPGNQNSDTVLTNIMTAEVSISDLRGKHGSPGCPITSAELLRGSVLHRAACQPAGLARHPPGRRRILAERNRQQALHTRLQQALKDSGHVNQPGGPNLKLLPFALSAGQASFATQAPPSAGLYLLPCKAIKGSRLVCDLNSLPLPPGKHIASDGSPRDSVLIQGSTQELG